MASHTVKLVVPVCFSKTSMSMLFLCFIGCLAVAEGRHRAGDMDTAQLTVYNELDDKIHILLQSTECYNCDLEWVKNISAKKNHSLTVDTRWGTRLAINNSFNNETFCSKEQVSKHFQEHGQYSLWLSKNSSKVAVICTGPIMLNDPMDSNIPIYAAIAILVVLAAFWILLKYLHRNHYLYKMFCCFGTERILDPDLGIPPSINPGDEGGGSNSPERSKASSRLKSLDTFRGISITIMIFADYGGGGYWFFKHSRWNGLTIADLVFPWFVYIMGTALAISTRSQLRKATSKRHICFRIVKRSLILFILGLLTNTGPGRDDMKSLRVPGVLQRFAITYLVVSLAHLLCSKASDDSEYKWWRPVRDILDYWPEWLLEFVFIGVYLGVTFGLEVPGCPTGYLGPGGLSEGGIHDNCTGGAAGYIDRWLFTDSHMYRHPTCKEVYRTGAYDPEGVLGTLNSFLMCFLGLQAGKIILLFKDYVQRIRRFLIWSIVLMAIAAVLCKFSKNEGWIPVNKNLWSLSFVLLLSGFAFLLLTACYMAIDVWRIWSGAPFFYPGMNSILLYLGHEVLKGRFPINFSVPRQHPDMLAMGLWSTACFVLISYVLFRKNLFFSV